MLMASLKLQDNYWETFELTNPDIEYLYNYLLESETPLTNQELVNLLVEERIRVEKQELEIQRSSGCDTYIPKEHYQIQQVLTFPALNWRRGEVIDLRPGVNPDLDSFEVIKVKFENGDVREYAANLLDHKLNDPIEMQDEDDSINAQVVLEHYQDILIDHLDQGLQANTDFVKIAGRWFPRALLVDVNAGHLNLAEALLDMVAGGPLTTLALLEQIEFNSNVNPKLLEFSLDLALQEDTRFDEVGSAGEVMWFLKRLEPQSVLEIPTPLRYHRIPYDSNKLDDAMQDMERQLDDELSELEFASSVEDEIEVCLIYPHWRTGTLPLSPRTRALFPTAYEAPRIRFTIVDSETGEKFPAWVVRPKGYVYGLKEWYEKRGLIPGSLLRLRKSKTPGEVLLQREPRRSNREWIRTVLVGSDGGIVYAMLKHVVTSNFDERMAIAIPDVKLLDEVWERMHKERHPFEKIVVDSVRELTKLNPQSHVHASELYAAVNVVRRCPPGPIMELLASNPNFTHVGDLHFRFSEVDRP